MFAKYGVEVPHDGMTWQEIIDIARRFPTEGDEKTRVYGLGSEYGMSMENLASSIANTQGLIYQSGYNENHTEYRFMEASL
ncbi:hypothetical protein [Paenibacillus glacialis]|uniref:Uncharacterized protein n=1 Tax=Paenibacillus glacialis TaxID=494026 RepID=A0A168LK95_9BACL|nr:hypothetical protein [Paenibacillus glacialis]OAB43504.1 hypothetical protein PGLA_08820 [Paenibacillus glacialis]